MQQHYRCQRQRQRRCVEEIFSILCEIIAAMLKGCQSQQKRNWEYGVLFITSVHCV